jgi:hypothetical protein
MNNVTEFRLPSREPLAGGGEPPHDDRMEARVATLEKTMGDVRERLAGIEAKATSIETHGAKSADIANLRADLSTQESRLIRWFVVTALGIGGMAFAIARLI